MAEEIQKIARFFGLPSRGPIEPIPVDQMLDGVPDKVGDLPLQSINAGVFVKELVNLDIVPPTDPKVVAPSKKDPKDPQGNITEGTYGGTQLALTDMYARVESG